MRRVGYFLVSAAVAWLVVVIPCRLWWGDLMAVYSLIACLVCVIPAAFTLWWSCSVQERSPNDLIVPALGGTGIRLLVVLAASWALLQMVPFLQQEPGFLSWVVFFYLLTLVLETTFLLMGQSHPKIS